MNSDTTILSAALITVGSTSAASILPHRVNRSPAGIECVKGEFPDFKMLIGQALVFTGLGIIAPAAPKFMGMFAVLIGTTAFTYYTLPILDDAFGGEGLCKAGTTEEPDEPLPDAPKIGTTPSYGTSPVDTLPPRRTLPSTSEVPEAVPSGSTRVTGSSNRWVLPRAWKSCPSGWKRVNTSGDRRVYANRIICERPQ